MTPSEPILLILDLDETLLYAHEDSHASPLPPDFQVFGYHIWKRPFLDTFLATVNTWFDLAVWTASSTHYAEAVIPIIFPDPTALQFVWTRQQSTKRFPRDGRDPFWLKNLNKVKRRLHYPLERILIIDDTPEKLERHYGNVIAIPPFEGKPADDELPAMLLYLASLREVANVRVKEKRFWRAEIQRTDNHLEVPDAG